MSQQRVACCHRVSCASVNTTVALSTYSDMNFGLQSFCSFFSDENPSTLWEDMREVLFDSNSILMMLRPVLSLLGLPTTNSPVTRQSLKRPYTQSLGNFRSLKRPHTRILDHFISLKRPHTQILDHFRSLKRPHTQILDRFRS